MPHASEHPSAPRSARGSRVRRWAAVAFLSLALAVSGGTSAQAAASAPVDDTTVAWSARPADTAQGSGRPNYVYEMLPGATLSDGILVTNRGAAPLTLDVYAADGFLTADGSLDLLAGGQPSTELGSWITLAEDSVTLDAGETAEIAFEIVVPSTAQPGDYAAGVVAAMSVESDTGIVTERRLGSRMHLRVAGDIAPSLALSDVRIDYHGTPNPLESGAATVSFTVTNTGNARLAPEGSATVTGPFGMSAATIPLSGVPELLPGSSLVRSVEVEGVPPLFLATADLSVGADVVQRPGAPAGEAASVAAVTASAATAAVPWTLLGIVAILAAAIVWWLVARRRGKAKHQRDVDAAVAAALAERDAAASTPVEHV